MFVNLKTKNKCSTYDPDQDLLHLGYREKLNSQKREDTQWAEESQHEEGCFYAYCNNFPIFKYYT